MKILLIEDEVKTAHYLKKGLEENGFEVESAMDGEIGLHLALENSYQLVIMDIILPGM
ncbi:MAG: response regulator, partial [Cytophagales bacterium]|nr:response regulator [Cytophagales bacterium]